jgi:hypothetical protein
MLVDVVVVRHVGEHRLWLEFEDGLAGELDVASILEFRGVFEPLAAPERFREVVVDPELGTIVWPNGADLAPETLYQCLEDALAAAG